MLRLRSEHALEPERVRQVEVSLYAEGRNFLQPMRPTSLFLAGFCLPLCVAVAVLDGEDTPKSFGPAQLRRLDLKRFTDRVQVREDATLTTQFPAKWSSMVAMELLDGTRHEARVDAPIGEPANPLRPADLAAKLLKSVGPVLGPQTAQRLLERCLDVRGLATVSRLWAR